MVSYLYGMPLGKPSVILGSYKGKNPLRNGEYSLKTVQDILTNLLKLLESEFSQVTINIWFSEARAIAFQNNTLYISVPSELTKKTIEERYMEILESKLYEIFLEKKMMRAVNTRNLPLSALWWVPPTDLPMRQPWR